MTAATVLTPVDPRRAADDLTIDELGTRIVGMAGRLAAATCEWLLLVAGFDRREGWSAFGLPSTARWLAHYACIAHRTAVDHVRVARALAEFPELAAGMASGRLSYSHVRAISRLAQHGETRLVTDLAEVAEQGTVGQLETVVRGLRSVEQAEAVGVEKPTEYVRHRWTSQSQWGMTARLDPERGAVVAAALEELGREEGVSAADALVRMAEIALAAVRDGSSARRGLRGDERAAVIVHLDASAVPPRSREPGEGTPYARIADGPGLPDRVVERLLCDGRIRSVVHDEEGNIRDLGRSRRLVSAAQFKALLLAQGGRCAFPGCRSRHRLEAHHVEHWIKGGRTAMANLVLLCPRHHHDHHDRGLTIERRGGTLHFFRADGREYEARPDPGAHRGSARLGGDGAAAPPAPSGQRLERRWAIDVLAGRRARAG